MFRRKYTLLLITPGAIARVDAWGRAAPQVTRCWSTARPVEQTTPELIESAWRLGPNQGGKVWVLSTDFWSGVVTLPPDVLQMVSGDERAQAIALEAESYSGISPFDCQIDFQRITPGDSREAAWWVTQIPKAELSEIDEAVSRLGAVFGGAAHPALPIPPQPDGKHPRDAEGHPHGDAKVQPWEMMQQLGELTISSAGMGPMLQQLRIEGGVFGQSSRAADPASGAEADNPHHAGRRCYQIVDGHWQPPSSAVDPVTENAVADKTATIDLSSASGLETYAAAWLESLLASHSGTGSGSPKIAAERHPLTGEQQRTAAAVLAMVVFGVCAANHWIGNRRIAAEVATVETLENERKALETTQSELQTKQKRIDFLRQEIDEADSRRAALQHNTALALRMLDQHRRRPLALIDALATAASPDCWIVRIEDRDERTAIDGFAISDQAVYELASQLETLLAPGGWRVHPAAAQRRSDHLVEFSIEFDQRPWPAEADGTDPLNSDLLTRSVVNTKARREL